MLKKNFNIYVILYLLLGFCFTGIGWAEDDDKPLESGNAPNVMIIFDNSDSMGESTSYEGYPSCSGGNCPNSKLYQAKKALQNLLRSDKIKNYSDTSYKYNLNLGFATYMSAKIPRVRAKYRRQDGGSSSTTLWCGGECNCNGYYIDIKTFDNCSPPQPWQKTYCDGTQETISVFLQSVTKKGKKKYLLSWGLCPQTPGIYRFMEYYR
ncbi:MAG: hypothetical protein V1872_04875 [bacterium]